MRIIVAPDSFKGTLSSREVIDTVSSVIQRFFPNSIVHGIVMGDGGEGTVDILVDVMHGSYAYKKVHSPLQELVEAKYGIVDKDTVVIEMAEASGLSLVSLEKRNPLIASSKGTGELVKEALDKGAKNIYLTVGGSATNDGGMGAAEALGMRFLDEKGNKLEPCGENLKKVYTIDDTELDSRLRDVNIIMICDVKNSLIGEDGATYVFGRQKGATTQMLDELEMGMLNYINVMEKKYKKHLRNVQGSGAGGGIAVPFMAVSNTKIQSGIETILELTKFEEELEGTDLVVTGEGRLDAQSAEGKVIMGISEACKRKGIPVLAIVGTLGEGAEQIYQFGVTGYISSINRVVDEKEVFRHCKKRLEDATEQALNLINIGLMLKKE